jgi:polysaccharide export outer membrane protein
MLRAATLVVACGACLGGCAGSSASGTAGYTASGAYEENAVSATSATAFAPTAGAHSSAVAEAADKLTSVAKPGSSAYKIGPLDVLDVSVFKVPDLTKTVQVAEDGNINYPLVGDIQAVGKTSHELERDLRQKLGAKYLRDPQVTVLVKEYNSQRVTIEGSVKTSGVYSIKGRTTLMQLFAMAGDIDITLDSGDVVIFRDINGTRSAAKFDLDAIKAGKAEDPEVAPGDVVVVNTSDVKVALSNILKALPLATTAAVFSGI